MSERGLTLDNTVTQVGIDDGQGILKIMMTVKEDKQDESNVKRSKYEDGFCASDFKLSGVKKLIILLASPATERHDNMKKLLGLLGINLIDF